MKNQWKRCLALLTAAMTLFPAAAGFQKEETVKAADDVLAFPGAVGGGRYATGGRGGEVVHVTNLNDSGAGSFREAVSQPNRIVVFDVSGTIELKGNILVSSNVTIAGQTAPGGSGITLKNYKLGMSGDNIICRFISSRPGPYAATSSGNDAWGGAKGSNSIIDHCSMGWTTDEQWGLYSNNEYYTVQYSVIGPADSWGGHSKGIHGFGLMMGKGYSTFDHNLIIHNVSRNFRGKVVGTETADFTNNVIYNWAYQTAYGTIGHLNYVNNTLKMGSGTTGGKHYVSVDSSTSPENFSIYLSGNRMLNQDGSVYSDVTNDNWAGITVKDGLGITKNGLKSASSFSTMVNGADVSTAMTAESAEDSFNHVVNFAGNGISPEKRTAVDRQAAEETRTGTGYLSGTAAYDDADDAQKANLDKYKIQCGVTYTYPEPVLTKEITDTDNDGMPDQWELVRGLDPDDPSDANGDYCGQGYTNIEYYINDLTVDAFPEGVVTPSPETGTAESISAFSRIEAEDFTLQEGVTAEECNEGGQNVGYIENGDYIMFRRIDFEEGARSFTVRAAGNAAGIELYLDKISDTPAAVCSFDGTENWQDWKDASFNIPAVTGTHDLYLQFTGGEGYLMNVNWFTFGKEVLPLNGTLIRDMKVLDEAYAAYWGIGENLADGNRLFGDRDVTYADLPAFAQGAEYILTSCDSKFSSDDLAEFTAAADLTTYVALDSRVETLPAWLSGWEKMKETCKNSGDVEFVFYRKSFAAGETVTLGTNGQSSYCVNYTVMVQPDQPGDITLDGRTDLADLVMLQRYLLAQLSLTREQADAADLNQDAAVNILDIILLKRLLLA